MGQPISGKHAVEVMAFVVAFEQPFTNHAIEALLGLQEALRTDYPIFNKTSSLKVRFEEGSVQQQQTNPLSGVFLQKLRADGRQAWSLRAEGNTIGVSCFDYEKWGSSSSKAIGHLLTAVSAAFEEQNPLAVIALQVIDRFIEPSTKDYDIGDVFNKKSCYLTKQATLSGSLWHVHQGWFENGTEPDSQCLNVLNLSTNSTPAGLITTIDHTLQIQSKTMSAKRDTSEELLRRVFDDLHGRNKAVLKDLLNSNQKKRISL